MAAEPQGPRLRSAWEVKAHAGEPVAVIRVRDLQGVVDGPEDAWGRRDKSQPIVVSAEVSLGLPFGMATSADQVSSDTVHYGLLSKSILTVLGQSADQSVSTHRTLSSVVYSIFSALTGYDIGKPNPDKVGTTQPFLDVSRVRYLSLAATLPKASLLGSGVTVLASAVFNEGVAELYSLSLRLHQLRVPTLVGVNDNERQAKQVVVADVEFDMFKHEPDTYVKLEGVVVKSMENSAFETLEALAGSIADNITANLTVPGSSTAGSLSNWQVKICLEKPTAVTFADAACVELRAGPSAL